MALHSTNVENKTVVQELGHVAFDKAAYYVDPELYPSLSTTVQVNQVLKKVPVLGKRKLNWDENTYATVELPEMIHHTDENFKKKLSI